MTGYSTKEVAKLLELDVARVRSMVKAGFLSPARQGRELYFTFQDLVLLRTAKGLVDARIAPARVKRVLALLKEQLPNGRPLTAVAIAAEGNRVVVRDGSIRWNPEDGQALFNFEVAELARRVAPLAREQADEVREQPAGQSAEDWYSVGCTLEVCAPEEARDAYRRAIELDPAHADAHLNLGRLLHEARELGAAEAHYRIALECDPENATASYNLGVVLQDAGRADEAASAYEATLSLDGRYADAHYNLSQLYERLGRPMLALRHLKAYKAILDGR